MPDTGAPGNSRRVSPDEAFALLGNETRVAILQALWNEFESGREQNAVPFSALFGSVEYADSGNFSYHLEKLTGPFVRKTPDGYALKQTGINIVRAVVTGTVTGDPAFGPTRVDVSCPLCTAPVEITYADELMHFFCSECDGGRRWRGDAGHLFGALIPPVGTEQQSAAEAFETAVQYSMHEISAFHNGICAHCSSRITTTVAVCDDHSPSDGLCAVCDRWHLATTRMKCPTCKRSIPPPASLVALDDPDVTAFYHAHGIRHRSPSWETVARSYEVREDLVSRDPLEVELRYPAGGDELCLTVDAAGSVMSVSN